MRVTLILVAIVLALAIATGVLTTRCITETRRANTYQELFEAVEHLPADTIWHVDTVLYSSVKYYKVPADTVHLPGDPVPVPVLAYTVDDSMDFEKVKVLYTVQGGGYLRSVGIDVKMKGVDYIVKPVVIYETIPVEDKRTRVYIGAWGWSNARAAAGLTLAFPSRWGVGAQVDQTGKNYAVGITYQLR